MKTLHCSIILREHLGKCYNSKKFCKEVHDKKPSFPDYSLPYSLPHPSFLVSHDLDSILVTFTTNVSCQPASLSGLLSSQQDILISGLEMSGIEYYYLVIVLYWCSKIVKYAEADTVQFFKKAIT